MTLAWRLSLVFVALLLPFGAFALWVAERGARAHVLEFTQRQNAPIAMYMAERGDLVRDGELDRDALAVLAEQITTINPSVETYVLDAAGHVVGQASAANVIAGPSVSLGPVRAFLATDMGSADMEPLLGDDPLDSGTRRPFSVHPLVDGEGATIGYVYAVLGGRRHTTLLDSLRSSHSLRGVVWTLAGALALATAGGALVSFTLTRRLRALTTRARRWEVEHDAPRTPGANASSARTPVGGDEIDALARVWESMSTRLREQYLALERVERERRELVAGVSHDLRTPLTMLQGYLETVLMRSDAMDAAEVRRCLETALRQSQRLERLIGDLFELSRLDAGERTLVPERFAIAELAQDALQDFEARAGRAGVTLSLHVVGRDAPTVCADIALVQRVLDNLLDNALRHVRASGRVRVEIAARDDGRVSVAVVDDGAGMSAETLARATAAGYRGGESVGPRRGDDTRERAGLGLAIVRGIVLLHGGTLDVRSRPGRGSTFAFTLTGVRSTRAPDGSSIASSASRSGVRTAPADRPARVLGSG